MERVDRCYEPIFSLPREPCRSLEAIEDLLRFANRCHFVECECFLAVLQSKRCFGWPPSQGFLDFTGGSHRPPSHLTASIRVGHLPLTVYLGVVNGRELQEHRML